MMVILEDLWAREHQYIVFEVVDSISQRVLAQRSACVWNVAKVKIRRFVEGRDALESFPASWWCCSRITLNQL